MAANNPKSPNPAPQGGAKPSPQASKPAAPKPAPAPTSKPAPKKK